MHWYVIVITFLVWTILIVFTLPNMYSKKSIWKYFTELGNEPTETIIALGISGLILAAFINVYLNGWSAEAISSLASGFTANLTTEFVSIIITVLILDRLNAKRVEKQEKERIIRQMSSHSNEFALDAVRLIREKNWHKDGSLCGRNFRGANLQNANLSDAILIESDFIGANLQGANFILAVLHRAKLQQADLSSSYTRLTGARLVGAMLQEANLNETWLFCADMTKVKLQGANLEGANLFGVVFEKTEYDKKTRWPDYFEQSANKVIVVEEEPWYMREN